MDAGEAVTLWASVESLVVVHNVAKRHNVGTMARSATAFGVSEIVLVGRRDFNAFGSHGSTSHLRFRHFHSLSQARHYLKGTGLSAKECEICDFFVYIPQYGCGTASLNVTVAASIVLHHFGVWAGFPERSREGNKFAVAEKPVKQTRRNYCASSAESIAEERKSRKQSASVDIFEENGTSESKSTNLLEALFDDRVQRMTIGEER
ncbi:SpoU rRNA Methylase family [Musa troglodytarum]|uniref:SpoU rRNA Methylase family n=1 Tax=Musa troglodytarum TaxID=320322 RepID=A0A9E7HPP8_9LILI|nr:SpoU rRNA Methylase family [Musa troglodytarum]